MKQEPNIEPMHPTTGDALEPKVRQAEQCQQQGVRRERIRIRKIRADVRPKENCADAPTLNGFTLANTLSTEQRELLEKMAADNSVQHVEAQPEEDKMSTKKKVIIGFSIAFVCFILWECRPLQEGAPCERSFIRADGKAKTCYSTNIGARLKAAWDTIRYGEKMNAYKISNPDGSVYGRYIGHAKPQ